MFVEFSRCPHRGEQAGHGGKAHRGDEHRRDIECRHRTQRDRCGAFFVSAAEGAGDDGRRAAAYGGGYRALQDDKGIDGGDAAHCRVSHSTSHKEGVRERIDGVEHQPRKRGERETQHLPSDAAGGEAFRLCRRVVHCFRALKPAR